MDNVRIRGLKVIFYLSISKIIGMIGQIKNMVKVLTY